MSRQESIEWISRAEATRRLEISNSIFDRVIEAGKVRRRELPGINTRYAAEDIATILAKSVVCDGPREKHQPRRTATRPKAVATP